ncbi:MAG: class I SAM-dependent methyltransferase [Spirochaetia bacterium]
MEPKDYDAWYRTPRGKWIGEREYTLLRRSLAPRPENSVLDIGCGTGFFTRCFARDQSGAVTGIDPDPESIEYAAAHAAEDEEYVLGSGEDLPFPPKSFDYTVSVTALCFVPDQIGFLREMARTARAKIAVGVLNRDSLLWYRKGKEGGKGAYAGAHWHTRRELTGLFADAGLSRPVIKTAIFFPSGNGPARLAERILPRTLPWGGFMLAVSDLRES